MAVAYKLSYDLYYQREDLKLQSYTIQYRNDNDNSSHDIYITRCPFLDLTLPNLSIHMNRKIVFKEPVVIADSVSRTSHMFMNKAPEHYVSRLKEWFHTHDTDVSEINNTFQSAELAMAGGRPDVTHITDDMLRECIGQDAVDRARELRSSHENEADEAVDDVYS